MTSTPSSGIAPNRNNKMASKQPVNLNHLLNFSLPPRETRMVSIPRRSRKTGTVQGVWNKERFINAQYRFVMNPTGDYTVHFADPDIFFQWNDILQVIVPRSSPFAGGASEEDGGAGHTTCPICLSPPTAPRMTKCGHIYCFPCILHYLSTSENKWARCPICFDSVNAKQLKSVKWYDGPSRSEDSFAASASVTPSAPREGSTIRMRLIQRPQITTLALPRSQTWPSDLLPPHQAPFHFLPDVLNFSKFMLATPDYLIAELTKDRDQLSDERRMFAGMEDHLGLYFVNAADEQVQHQIAKAAALESLPLKMQIDKAQRDQKDIFERSAAQVRLEKAERESRAKVGLAPSAPEFVPSEFLATRPAGTPAVKNGSTPNPNPNPKAQSQSRSNPRQRRNVNPPPPSTSTYYYYQAASGLPIYLHPLDIRILVSHFSDYASFPDSIDVRVEATSESTVNDDLRKRYKYLSHLPEGADVIFVETDLESVVGAEGLKSFEGPLKMRATKRKEKVKKDDKAKARAEEREKEKERAALARFTHSPVHPRSDLAPQEFVSLASSAAGLEGSEDEHGSATSSSPPAAPGVWGQRSFASALHSASSPAPRGGSHRRLTAEEEADAEAAWHDLEQQSLSSGGRKKKGSRMVVLGGGGPSWRRR
ncbi:hypothetical protein D9611_005524 [Ephemerocybe angulata]|uniref:RING-type domain-containing protein n=1 Tax=Ephemerocybe angulata TaxID=980116 RepID=A0A8H5F4P3_9AGAR|nr:hypothetical protein D9611_005524 [Tulosesus angulatus]